MKISIAMATYNGASFIEEQLDSFLKQDLLPDELIISDDGSSDSTLSIVEEFSKRAPFPVFIFRNKKNLGYAKNFGSALKKCSGNLIFLSDQDDVWLPSKISTIVALANANPTKFLFMNDAEITVGNNASTGLTKLQQTLSLGLNENDFTTGCCMALRKNFLEIVLPIATPEYVHDTWINKLAIRLGGRVLAREALQYYRRHGENTSDWLASKTSPATPKDLNKAYIQADSQYYARLRVRQLEKLKLRITKNEEKIISIKEPIEIEDSTKAIQKEIEAIEQRLSILSRPRVARAIPATAYYLKGKYRFFSGWKSLIKDMIRK